MTPQSRTIFATVSTATVQTQLMRRGLRRCLMHAVGLPVFCAGAAAPATPSAHIPADSQVPIACGGVAVFPGDVLMGDGDGVMVIPAELADEVAAGAEEQEGIEAFIFELVRADRPVIGTYPPTDAVREEYARWLDAGRPSITA